MPRVPNISLAVPSGSATVLGEDGGVVKRFASSDLGAVVGVQLSVVNAAARTVLDVAGDMVFVTSFDNGADTSDSTRIQRAVEHIRASVTTVNSRDRSVALVFPPGLYTAGTQIDMTALRSYGVSVLGHGATLHGKCSGKPVIDALYTRWITFVGLTIIGDATDTPKYGVQIGVKDSANESGGLLFDAVTIVGTFTGAALYNRGSEASNFHHCRFWNNSALTTAYCVIMDGNNAFASSSDFVTVTAAANTNASFLGNKFIGCDLRRQTTGSPIVYSGAPGQHEWKGCYAVSYDDYIVEFYRVSGVAHMELDIHCETSACLGFLLVDNVNPSATVFLQGLKLRDNNHQGSTAIIDTTGTTQQVICDGIDIEIAAPVSGVPLVGATSGSSAKVLLSGEIRWQTTHTLNLSNCRFAGKIYTETSTTITHTIGSYEIVRRPNSADSRVVEFKGETRFSGTTLGTDTSNYVAINGSGTGGGVGEVFVGGTDTNLDLRLTPKGTGRVRFGTRAAITTETVTHYIEAKDAAGTVIKIAVVS